MPGTANEEFMDALIRHQIFLLRVSGDMRNRILAVLDRTDADIADKIKSRLAGIPPGLSPKGIARYEVLRKLIRGIRAKSWDKVDEIWVSGLAEIAKAEPEFVATALRTVAPVRLDLVLPAPALLRSIVTTRPFEGRVLKEWARSIRNDDINRMADQIRIGMLQGESSAEIARRVVGTARLAGVDGVTEITRRQAAAITRTAVNAISNEARDLFFQENLDLLDWELFVATLDARTTPICRSLDGKRYKVGEGPRPPMHFSCRSLRVAFMGADAMSTRPAKASTERGLLREFADKHGLAKVARREDLPFGTKKSFDEFARKRIRQLTGVIPAKTTYGVWLARQSAAFQDDVLGKTKGRLFRRGGLSLEKFVNRKGDEMTLAQLARSERRAFIAAGLNPDDFQ